jgi:hypothetical protein
MNLIFLEMKINIMLLFLLLCFSFHNAKAQLKDTWEKGTIITSEDVKIDGYIKTNDLSHLSSEFCFKVTEDDEKCINYDTTQIKSFQTITGKTFDLLSIKIDNSSTEISVFANLILKGETSLYKTIYKSTTFYIVVTKDRNYVLQDDELMSGETEIRKYYFQGVLNTATEGYLTKNYSEIAFKEKDFIKVISGYNTSKGYVSTKVTYDEKNIHYHIINIGYGGRKNESEFFFQAMYRLYYPKISRSTSLNLGLNYFNYTFSDPSLSSNKRGFNESLLSIPVQFQQNILNKKIRPYFFWGLNLSYLFLADDKNYSLIESGLQKNYGLGFLYGGGIEIDVFNRIMLKTEFRHEFVDHLLLFGVGYNFSR